MENITIWNHLLGLQVFRHKTLVVRRKWVGPPSDSWPSAPSCPCCSLGSLCLRKQNELNLVSHCAYILWECFQARERNIHFLETGKHRTVATYFEVDIGNSQSFIPKMAQIQTKKMTGCNLEARLYSLKAFLASIGFKGPSTCSWQLYQLHPPSFFKIIGKSTNRQLIKSPLERGSDGNGNFMKLSRSRWFNIMGPHLRREYHHRWPWWKRGRIRSGTPMPTWPGFGHGFTWIYTVKIRKSTHLDKSRRGGFNSKKQHFMWQLQSNFDFNLNHPVIQNLSALRNHFKCEKVGGTVFVLHSHRTRQDHVHHQNGKWPQTHCYLRACHRQGDIKVGPLASRTTSPIDGIVVLARGRLPQRSQNWSVLQDDWHREEKNRAKIQTKNVSTRQKWRSILPWIAKQCEHNITNLSNYWVPCIYLFPVYNMI